ncbi:MULTISPECIES: copper chaperone PCu(A)C [Stenotrophomonas]|uniref:Copper chaperone PCu(A)C n=1 Tax=Stenotrophomonas lactitubi TaxID=2045214 RepID=A0AAW4GGV3_9GAMM|nr:MULTISPECIES: copper chaperone PCu(A)C [Stenotrophomonas]MBM9914023.1 copper chaperone PCu(A)C [Stenotrophomonas lactitubi]MBM9922016.1 copper chaperone PCu(A)C [Stenotrophomonas lactitubi]MBM9936581.1 copper chaperone PCu(A)C [Stenotrophomonas lactitubi]
MITKPCVGVLFVLCALAASASAAEQRCVTVEQGWARMPPNPAMPMTAGYGTIRNGCSKAVTITGASSVAFGDVSLHETTVVDGISRMRAIERLPLAPGARAELKPGGLHLMLMDGKGALKEGQAVPLRLQLEGGGEAGTTLTVRKAAP